MTPSVHHPVICRLCGADISPAVDEQGRVHCTRCGCNWHAR